MAFDSIQFGVISTIYINSKILISTKLILRDSNNGSTNYSLLKGIGYPLLTLECTLDKDIIHIKLLYDKTLLLVSHHLLE